MVLQEVPGPHQYNIVMDKGWLLVSVSLNLRLVVPQQRLCSRPTIELDGNVIINRRYRFGRGGYTLFQGIHQELPMAYEKPLSL